jgi:hypothetical protein
VDRGADQSEEVDTITGLTQKYQWWTPKVVEGEQNRASLLEGRTTISQEKESSNHSESVTI